MKPLHILRCYPGIPPSPGGLERHVKLLTDYQRSAGCVVTLVYNVGDGGNADDVRVFPWISILHLRPQVLRDFLFYAGAAIAILRRRIRVDVVHIHGDWGSYLFGRLVACAARARLMIASMHGHVVARHSWRAHIYRFATRPYGLGYATGRREAEVLSTWTGQKWQWITSGISEQLGNNGKEEGCAEILADLVSVGSLLPVKNHMLMLDVAARLPHRKFLIVGDGPLRRQLEADVRRRRLQNVWLRGQVPQSELGAILRRSRIFLLTSSREGTPTVLLEAMYCGLPVVTTPSNDYSGIVVPGLGGYVSRSFDADEIAGLVETMLADAKLIEEMGNHNRAHAHQFTWPAIARRITERITNVIERSAATAARACNDISSP
jgi:glycosyltransferase involved in cell wall biosynthesis